MIFIGTCFVLFGILVLINPALIAYIIAFFFIFIGSMILFLAFQFNGAQKQNSQNQKTFSFWKYEFTRKK